MKLQSIIAVVTGAGSGMGVAVAHTLHALGCKVALLDINAEALIKQANELDSLSVVCDVTSSDNVKSALDTVEKKLGVPRICINCAGILHAAKVVGRKGPMPLEDFNKVININLTGTFNVMSQFAARLTKQEPVNPDNENGVIVNVASIAAFEGQIGQVAYSASKGGIVAMTLPAARELARFGIRVLALAPGLIETPMLSGLQSEAYDSLVASTIFPARLGKPEEIAAFIVSLIENPLLNGSTHRLDGAIRLAPR